MNTKNNGLTTEVLGAFLKKRRKELKLKIKEVSASTGLPEQWIRDLEAGTFGAPFPVALDKLAELYEAPVSYLLCLSGYNVQEDLIAKIKWDHFSKHESFCIEDIETIKGWDKIPPQD